MFVREKSAPGIGFTVKKTDNWRLIPSAALVALTKATNLPAEGTLVVPMFSSVETDPFAGTVTELFESVTVTPVGAGPTPVR